MSGRISPLPESAGHTPIYKLHRYFARRPHNQFRELIMQVSEPGAVVLDCMAGGGVTLTEGLTVGRRVVSVDVNPIAALVQRAQVAEWDPTAVEVYLRQLVERLPSDVRDWYSTSCPDCSGAARVRWLECAYTVICPACSQETSLSNTRRTIRADGRPIAGRYTCQRCSEQFRSIDVERIGHDYLNARVRCEHCGCHRTRDACAGDRELADRIAGEEEALVADYGLDMPSEPIPIEWDRQHEDGLHRKGFTRFVDLFTPRNRLILAFLIREMRQSLDSQPENEAIGSVAVLSSLVRYLNNMTVATPGWMDGRPVAWAKHAYWTPNQFVECNAFEYLDNRIKAMKSAAKDRSSRFRHMRHSQSADAVLRGDADYTVLRTDASELPIPRCSIDAVITDPPFGSNVQYGELTSIWTVWMKDLNPFWSPDFMKREVLVTRRTKLSPKTFSDYQEGLTRIFLECFRVLKPGGVLAFTFNNKNAEAWYAVMRAAFDAGFTLRRENIAYQDVIHAYRDTAHLRFKGELQGDVVYAFEKIDSPILGELPQLDEWRAESERRLHTSAASEHLLDTRVAVHVESLGLAATALQLGEDDLARRQMEISQELVSQAGRK